MADGKPDGASDEEVEGVWRWTEGPEAGQQFWQGLAGGSAVDGSYTNWQPGEPNQFFGPGNPENFAHMRANGRWNDLPASQNLNYIIEWGGDLFVQNPDVNVSSDSVAFRNDYLAMMGQIEEITNDASFRGVKLLQNDDLETVFNKDRTSQLETEGINGTLEGLGLTGDNFVSKTEMTKLLGELQDARQALRDYGSTLSSDLNVLQTRRTFIESSINTLESGGDDLVLADLNEAGSEILSLQTRQQLQFQTLSLTSNLNILDLFS